MAKIKTQFICQTCGAHSPKWLGRCPECSGWNTLVEEVDKADVRPAWGSRSAQGKPIPLSEVRADSESRRLTGIQELDRVLGGGVVPGGLTLLGGDPGIGKSTLLLAALDRLAVHGPVLYVTGEESLRQTKMRAERLGVCSPNLSLFAETDAERILHAAEAHFEYPVTTGLLIKATPRYQ